MSAHNGPERGADDSPLQRAGKLSRFVRRLLAAEPQLLAEDEVKTPIDRAAMLARGEVPPPPAQPHAQRAQQDAAVGLLLLAVVVPLDGEVHARDEDQTFEGRERDENPIHGSSLTVTRRRLC